MQYYFQRKWNFAESTKLILISNTVQRLKKIRSQWCYTISITYELEYTKHKAIKSRHAISQTTTTYTGPTCFVEKFDTFTGIKTAEKKMVTYENKDRDPHQPLYCEYYHENSNVKVHRPQPMVCYRTETLPICSSIVDGNQKGISYTHQSAFHGVNTDGYNYDRRSVHKMALNCSTEAEENTQVTWCSTGANYRCSVAVTGGEVLGDVHLRNSWKTYLEDFPSCSEQGNEDQDEIDVGDYKTDVFSQNTSSPECSFRSEEISTCLSPVDASTRHLISECPSKRVTTPPHPVWDMPSAERFAQYTKLYANFSKKYRSRPICISDIGMPRSQSPPNGVTSDYNKATSLDEGETLLKSTGIPLSVRLEKNDRMCWLQSTTISSFNNERGLSGEQVTDSRIAGDELCVKTDDSFVERGSCYITDYGLKSHNSSPNSSNGEKTKNSSTASTSYHDRSSYRKGPEQNMFNYNPMKNMLKKGDLLPAVRSQDSVPQDPAVNKPHDKFSSTGAGNVHTLILRTKEFVTRSNDIERNLPTDKPPSKEFYEPKTSVSSQSYQSKFIVGEREDHKSFIIKCPKPEDKQDLCETSASPMLYSAIGHHAENRSKSPFEETVGSHQKTTSSKRHTESGEDRGESCHKISHLRNGNITEDKERLVVRRVLSRKVSHIENDDENTSENRIHRAQNSLSMASRIKIDDNQSLDQGDLPLDFSPLGSCNPLGEEQGSEDNNKYLRRSSSVESIVEIGDTDFVETTATYIKKSTHPGNQALIIEEQRPPKQSPSSQHSYPLNNPTQTDLQHICNNQDVSFHRRTVLIPSRDLRQNGGETATEQLDTIRETILSPELRGSFSFSAEDTVLRNRVLILLWVLLGESRLREVGYPKEPVHRILWRTVDVCCSVAGVKSAAAIPLNADHDCGADMLCFRDHTHRFLEVCAPTREHWKQFGWAGLTVDAVVRKIYEEELVTLLRLQVLPPGIQQAAMHLSQLGRVPPIQENSSLQQAPESDSAADKLQTVVVPVKKKRGRPAKISRKVDEGGRIERVMLWRFLLNLLEDPRNAPCIHWVQRDEGIFRILNTDWLARLWGRRHGNPRMTYEKMARAMRTYYRSKVLQPVPRLRNLPRKLVYKFNPAVIHKVASMKLSCSTFSGRGLNYNTSNNK